MEIQDKIGRKGIINKICALINHLNKDEHFCLALDGEWGSGKSFVLNMLYEQLKDNDSYLTIRYDAWECSFYDDPLIAIFSSIVDSAYDKLPTLRGGKKALKESGKKLGEDILEELSSKPGKLGTAATIIKKVIKHITSFKEAATLDTDSGKVAEFKSYQTYLKEVKNSLNEFTTFEDYLGKQNKLIILVDELDRCLPDMQLKILERLHHLFDVKNCVVICALNTQSVSQNVATTYGVDGFEYQRKFFDFTYKLKKSTNTYLASLLDDLEELTQKMNDLAKKAKNANEPTMLAYTCLNYGSYHVLDYIDNREAKRYYDALVMICNEFGWENITPIYLYFIIVALYIKKYLFNDFLTERDILSKNQSLRENLSGDRQEMPYYDYLKEFVGIDRKHLPQQLEATYGYRIAEYSWDFNEMVYYSIEKTGQGPINKQNCIKLRELVLLYGGEPKVKDVRKQGVVK